MGRGQRNPATSAAAPAPAAPTRRGASQPKPRPFAHLSDADVNARYQEAFRGSDRALERELEREMWRRPGGSACYPGDELGPLVIDAVDADRLRIIVRLPEGGLKSLTLTHVVNLMSGRVREYPTEPDKRTPPTPIEYGQNVPRPPRGAHPSHVPVDGHPESVALAAERKRIDAERDRMSEIRPSTDIVEFERLYAEQGAAQAALAHKVAKAGGLDPAQGLWGARYIISPPELADAEARQLQDRYEHIQQMRDRGESDEAIIAWLEAEYGSPFGGPRPAAD